MKLDQNKIRFTNTLDLAGWLEETDIGIAYYEHFPILKSESNVFVLDENEKILAKIEIIGRRYYKTAENIDRIVYDHMCYRSFGRK